jgi:membrane-bound metal-dependent hydrolase YbcI (DUF457 family)
MYAINHATTALVLQKNAPKTNIWLLLVPVQFVELLWVLFNYLGIEHYSITEGKVHLDYLPWSHSILSATVFALLAFVFYFGRKQRTTAIVVAIGILSHILLDILMHEQDIALSPFAAHPAYGLGIIRYPFADFAIEWAYGIACCMYFGARRNMYIMVSIFNLLDLPVMLASGSALDVFVQYPFLLPTFILFQILITWFFVARLARPESQTDKSFSQSLQA